MLTCGTGRSAGPLGRPEACFGGWDNGQMPKDLQPATCGVAPVVGAGGKLTPLCRLKTHPL